MARLVVITVCLLALNGCISSNPNNEDYMDEGFSSIDPEEWTHIEGCAPGDVINAEDYYFRRKDIVATFLETEHSLPAEDNIFDMDSVSWVQRRKDIDTVYLQYLFADLRPDPDNFYLVHGGLYVRFDLCTDAIVEGGEYRAGG